MTHLIALAYFTIPFTIWWILQRRRDTPFRLLVYAFVVFIFSCGLVHALEVWAIFEGVYWVSGASKGITALASLATASLIVARAPHAIELPSVAQYQQAQARTAEAEARFRAVVAGNLDAFLLLEGPDLLVRYANGPAIRLLDALDQSTVEARPLTDLFSGHALAQVRDAIDTTREQGGATRFDTDLDRAGELRCVQGQAVPLPDGIGIILRDVTEEQAALQDQRTLAAVVETSEDAIVTADRNALIGSWNHGAELLFGYGTTDMIGARLDALAPDDDVLPDLRAVFDGEGLQPVETELLRRDGTTVPVSLRLSAVDAPDGEARFASAIIRDLTTSRQAEALRRALAEKEVLLREIHHRVKNDLQLAASMVGLARRRVEHPAARQALEDSQGRIRAVALVHEQLYQQPHVDQIHLDAFLDRLLRTIGTMGRDDVTVALHAEPVIVDVHAAIPCGLIVHEWVVNAIKHAFPDGRPGTVTAWARRTDAGLEIGVSDDGVPFPEAPASGLGDRIVAALAKQLGTTAERAHGPPKRQWFALSSGVRGTDMLGGRS